ncbi:MAG: LysM peptidoglycan-binding domain-containing protein [Candidatus Limnocylindria bacterium]
MHRRSSLPLVRIAAIAALLAVGAIVVPAAATDRVVVVRQGDTLSEIALRNGVTVAQLMALNTIPNPNRIYPGQRVRISTEPAAPPAAAPATAEPIVHVVRPGEHLTGIAQRYGTTIAAIAKANRIANPSYLRVGQRLTVPGTTAAPSGADAGASSSARMNALVAARADIGAIIVAEASAQGVPVAFALAVAWQESGWQPGVVSSAGAVGVMQLTPPTADWVAGAMLHAKITLTDARSNVRAGVRLLKHYLARYGNDKSLTLAAYYQGQTAADRHGIYRVTRPYIASILALEAAFSR